MDSVNVFNSELSSLYDVKPPISKGKMTAITKAALKAVKFYKHVVQSVEKFIQKCKPEYKIPGLYVIDSIIRQSRHQFGSDKDIFAGRFQRNLQTTFVHLYKCPVEDKSKVIRVLNLWQKNRIFLPEAIQPLFDLADPNNPIWETAQVQQQLGSQDSGDMSSQPSLNSMSQSNDQHPVHFKKELLDYDYDEEDDMVGGDGVGPSGISHLAPPPPQLFQVQAAVSSNNELAQGALSGFDALGTILTNPEVLRQLQTLQEQMAAAAQQQHQMGYLTPEQERQRKLAELNKQEAAFDQRLAQTVARLPFAVECDLPFIEAGEIMRSPVSSQPNVDQNSNHQHNHGLLLPPPFFHQLNAEHLQQMLPNANSSEQQHQQHMNMMGTQPQMPNPFGIPLNFPIQTAPPMHYQHPQRELPPTLPQQNSNQFNHQQLQQLREVGNAMGFPVHFKPDQPPPFDHINFSEHIAREDHRDKERRDRGMRSGERSRRSRSRSESQSLRRNSRSNSRTRGRKRHMRSRSRSRDRKEDKEREKERQRKGLPSIKREQLSVCSTTLWVGHLSKLVSQEEISDTFGAYGDVVSIDLISPRGCAFVVMNRRQDACRALDRLKNSKLQSKSITLAWAPGKGVKGRDWKDYWEVEAGVSYIPWSKLKSDTSLEEFEEGGSIDEDSLPDFLKKQYKAITAKEEKGTKIKDEKETTKSSKSDVAKEDTKQLSTNNSLHITANSPSLLTLNSEKIKSGDTDIRPPLEGPTTTQAPTINQVGPTLAPQFGMPPPAAMMNVSSMAINMMIPPPMLGLPPQFQGLNSLPNISMPMMGMIPPPRMQQDPSTIKGLNAGQGLLGEMPMPQQPLNVQKNANNSQEFVDLINEENRKRRPDDRRENREKKRSRFDDPDDRNSPLHDIDSSPSNFERSKDCPPLFERLKNMAGGYAFAGQGNKDKMGMTNSLLGVPIGPSQQSGIGPRGIIDPRMPDSRGFPAPLLARGGGHPGQFGAPRGPPFSGERGPRPWFDGAQNPFMHQNSQNPFAGNPFIQQGGGNHNDNPFELVPPRGGGGGERGRGQFFGGPEPPNHFPQRGTGGGRGWSRGDGPPNSWRGPPRGRGGLGSVPGHGRGGPSWHRHQDEDLGLRPRDNDRDRDTNRNFRGGRGRDGNNRDRGSDFDRSGDRRRDWDRGRGRDRDTTDAPNRDRDREQDRDFRDRGRDRENRETGNYRDSRRSLDENSGPPKIELEKLVGDENWESDVPAMSMISRNLKNDVIPASINTESWVSNDDTTELIRTEMLDAQEEPLFRKVENWESSVTLPIKFFLTTENQKGGADTQTEETNILGSSDSSYRIHTDSYESNDTKVNAAVVHENENPVQDFPQEVQAPHSYNREKYQVEPQFLENRFQPDREGLDNNYEDIRGGDSLTFSKSFQRSEESSSDLGNNRETEQIDSRPSMEQAPVPKGNFPMPLMDVNCVDDRIGGELEKQKQCLDRESTFEQNNFNNSQHNLNALEVTYSEVNEVINEDE